MRECCLEPLDAVDFEDLDSVPHVVGTDWKTSGREDLDHRFLIGGNRTSPSHQHSESGQRERSQWIWQIEHEKRRRTRLTWVPCSPPANPREIENPYNFRRAFLGLLTRRKDPIG